MSDKPPGFIDGMFKDIFGGYKYNPSLSSGERSAKALEDINSTLKKNRDEYLRDRYSLQNNTVVPYTPPPAPQMPDVNIDLSGVGYEFARELTPAFSELAEGQRELAGKVDDLGYTGQKTLEQNILQTHELKNLSKEADWAWQQRNELIRKAGESIEVQNAIRQHLGLANVQLHELNNIMETMESNLLDALGDISYDIQNLTDEMVAFKLQLFNKLDDMQSVFLWAHREKMLQLQSIEEALRNPRRVRALETWQIGERARKSGELKKAVGMYEESLAENPSESRNYTSLGLLSLDAGEIKAAKDYFYGGARYAEVNKEQGLSATNLLYLAKIESYERHLPAAKDLLLKAYNLDPRKVAVWFEMARIEAELGNTGAASEYVKAIFLLSNHRKRSARKVAAGYPQRILTDPFLAPLAQEFVRG